MHRQTLEDPSVIFPLEKNAHAFMEDCDKWRGFKYYTLIDVFNSVITT